MAACSKPSAGFNSSSSTIGASRFSIRPNGATFWRSLMIATVAPRPSLPARSPSNIGTTSSATPPSATRSWTASFTTPTVFNSPEKACESRTPAVKLLTPPQTPEPITMSVEAAAHDRVKYLLTIKRNERSPSREIAAHNQRNAQRTKATLIYRRTGNLRAVQLLLGHTKIESTVRYLGVEVDDALAIAEQVDV